MSGRHDQSRYAFLRDNDYRYLVVPLVRCPAPTFALRGDLGLTIARVDPARDPAMVTPTAKRVRPDGAAAAAGLVVGDQIVRVDSHLVTDREVALFGPLTKVRPGDDVELQLPDGRASLMASRWTSRSVGNDRMLNTHASLGGARCRACRT